MRLARIKIENYRRIPDFDIEVRDHVLVVGPNDSGKSSILHALHMLLGSSLAQILATSSIRDFTDPARAVLVEVELREFSDEERAAFPDAIFVGPPERLLLRLEVQVDPVDSELITALRSLPEAGRAQVPTREQMQAIGWQYVPAARSLERELGGGRASVIRSLLSSLDLADDKPAIVAAVEELRSALDDSSVLGDFREDLASALSSALPTPVSKDDVRLITSADLENDPLGGVTLGIQREGHVAPLLAQSDGIRSLAAISVLGMAHRHSNILGIDEPETHLHPTAQRAIGRLLQAGSHQRVIATHSSQIASRFAAVDLLALGPTRTPRQLPLAAHAASTRFLVRWWGSTLVEPLTARTVVVVEGPADRLLVAGAALAAAVPLDRLDVALVDLGGADNFEAARKFLGPDGFDVLMFGLLDEDHRTDWAQVLGIPSGDLETHGYAVAEPDLEGEYVEGLGPARVLELLMGSQLFNESQVLSSCGSPNREGVGAATLAEFCRRNKTLAAGAVSSGLTASDVSPIPAIESLLQSIQA